MSFIHANDSAMGSLGYERRDNDWYPTPPEVTEALIPYIRQYGTIWEPACGDGAMAKVLRHHFRCVYASDIADRGYGDAGINFLNCGHDETAIVTNPPFNLSEEFVRHALTLTHQRQGYVAMLLRHEWDCAKTRSYLFQYPFARKVVLTWRPRWIADSTGSPRHNYAWYIWDWMWSGSPVISYASKP